MVRRVSNKIGTKEGLAELLSLLLLSSANAANVRGSRGGIAISLLRGYVVLTTSSVNVAFALMY